MWTSNEASTQEYKIRSFMRFNKISTWNLSIQVPRYYFLKTQSPPYLKQDPLAWIFTAAWPVIS